MHYLDNSATTKPCDEAVAAAVNAMTEDFGNPSSLYNLGLNSENIVSDARKIIAEFLYAREDEIYFTSCGSESNNTAIFGAVKMRSHEGRHIVTTSVEHPSVLHCMKQLEKNGYDVTYLDPDENGTVSVKRFENAIRKDTVLVSVMAVNNETGAYFPIDKIESIIETSGSRALFHIDCVQAFGKIPLDVTEIQCDFLTASAHKIHGLKGCGILYVKKNIKLPPYIFGGGQEKGFRSGTEAVPNIAAFGAACKALPNINEQLKKISELKSYTESLIRRFPNVTVNSPENGCPYILNFSFKGYRSETLLHHFEKYNIYVSSGSACSKGKGSHVLISMGLEREIIDSAIRVSFSRFSNKNDADALLFALQQANELVHK